MRDRGETAHLDVPVYMFLCYPTAKNPKSAPLSIFRLTLHELPEWSTPWAGVFPVRFVSTYHLFVAGRKSGTRAEGLML